MSDKDRSIVAEGLTREFGDLRAVDGVDLRVDSGRVFGFLGPNGSGKSTLVRMLTTILAPTSGRASVAGHDVAAEGDQVRAKIGVALQEVGLDPIMTARELLVLQSRLYGTSPAKARATAERLLATVGLQDVSLKKRVGDYSGGMKRRLDLALALVHDPDVLFLDEPTTGLDPASRMAIWEEVRRLNKDQGVTIFLTTQYLEEADRLADQVAIINRGMLVAQGSPGQLKSELGSEVVVLSFAMPELAERANDVVGEVAPRRQLSGRELICYFQRSTDILPVLIRTLDEAGLSLAGLTLSRPTLDDVFLRATGERLAAPESAEKADQP